MNSNPQILKPIRENANGYLAKHVLEELIAQGVEEFCLCPGARNAPLIYPLIHSPKLRLYYWPEERSAAFFALGRIKATSRPVVVVTTSGTAAAETLPAAMEAYYTGLPLVLLTADRPRRFRGTGAPQTVDQAGLFSRYVHVEYDLAREEECHLNQWSRRGPLHLNVCFEEPRDSECQNIHLNHSQVNLPESLSSLDFSPDEQFEMFMAKTRFPLVVVGALSPSHCEAVTSFLLHLKAPVYLEGISGIREDPRLEPFRITSIEDVWNFAIEYDYPIDGILRLGGVPTARLWRDLEQKTNIHVFSVSEQPFSGLSRASVLQSSLSSFCSWAETIAVPFEYQYSRWKEADQAARQALSILFQEEPQAEPSLIHALSAQIPPESKVYLGNSLPIREWDQAATYQYRAFKMACSRGVNGIDGQLATFLGYSSDEQENWSILGDLTVLYDLVAPWIIPQLPGINVNLVLINNGGGKIFRQMFAHPAFQNIHQLNFESLASFWGWRYERWESIPQAISPSQGGRLIELIPNSESTERFLRQF